MSILSHVNAVNLNLLTSCPQHHYQGSMSPKSFITNSSMLGNNSWWEAASYRSRFQLTTTRPSL